jgi:Tfp pilus assembly protein PilF
MTVHTDTAARRWRRFGTALLLGLVALGLTGCGQLKARTKMREAMEHYNKEDYQFACPAFEEALRYRPDDLELKKTLAYCYMAWYKPLDTAPENLALIDKSAKLFREILAVHPEDEKLRDSLLALYLNAERYNDAIGVMKDQLQKRPNDIEIMKQIASLYQRSGDLETSFTWYEKWAQVEPGKADPWYAIGSRCWSKAYCEPNRCEDPNLAMDKRQAFIRRGLDALTKAIQLDPNYCEAVAYRNLLYRERAKWIDFGDKRAREEAYRMADADRDRAVECVKKKVK